MSWRVANSIRRIFVQLNAAHPARSKASDGTIGDAAHASRDSDHNPWVKDGDMGVVTAGDITHDPAHGVNCNVITETIRADRDPRVKYIIWNRRICRSYPKDDLSAWEWGPYSGPNAHTKHMHISVKPDKPLYDNVHDWKLTLPAPPPKDDEMDANTPLGPDPLKPGEQMTLAKLCQRVNHMYGQTIDGDGTASVLTLVKRIAAKVGAKVEL